MAGGRGWRPGIRPPEDAAGRPRADGEAPWTLDGAPGRASPRGGGSPGSGWGRSRGGSRFDRGLVDHGETALCRNGFSPSNTGKDAPTVCRGRCSPFFTKTRHRSRSSARSTRRGVQIHPTPQQNARNADAVLPEGLKAAGGGLQTIRDRRQRVLGPPSRRGRSGHGFRFRRGTAAPEAVVQL